MCSSQKSQTLFWFHCNMILVYFILCNVTLLTPSLSFPLRQSGVSGIAVVIIVEMQDLPATIMLFRGGKSLYIDHTTNNRWSLCDFWLFPAPSELLATTYAEHKPP